MDFQFHQAWGYFKALKNLHNIRSNYSTELFPSEEETTPGQVSMTAQICPTKRHISLKCSFFFFFNVCTLGQAIWMCSFKQEKDSQAIYIESNSNGTYITFIM